MAGIFGSGREVSANGYFVGTFDFNSSNQFCTTTMERVLLTPSSDVVTPALAGREISRLEQPRRLARRERRLRLKRHGREMPGTVEVKKFVAAACPQRHRATGCCYLFARAIDIWKWPHVEAGTANPVDEIELWRVTKGGTGVAVCGCLPADWDRRETLPGN